jgi:outer membrane lipoprotein SlyB
MNTHISNIEPQSGKFPQAIIWIAGIALTLFCGVGIAAFMGWIPNSIGGGSDKTALASPPASPAPTVVVAPKAAATVPAKVAQPHPVAVGVVPAPVAPVHVASNTACAECGVIESVHEVDVKGRGGSGVGVVGGAVVGGLLGNQVGAGRGKDLMTVVGAVGGAVAGNEVEKRVKTTKSYSVTVRMSDGSSRVISEAGLPSWRTGDKVRLVNGVIQSNA